MSIRARRRQHLERMKAKAKAFYPRDPMPIKLANHLARCSCSMCGNPRRYVGQVTRQEAQAARPIESREDD